MFEGKSVAIQKVENGYIVQAEGRRYLFSEPLLAIDGILTELGIKADVTAPEWHEKNKEKIAELEKCNASFSDKFTDLISQIGEFQKIASEALSKVPPQPDMLKDNLMINQQNIGLKADLAKALKQVENLLAEKKKTPKRKR